MPHANSLQDPRRRIHHSDFRIPLGPKITIRQHNQVARPIQLAKDRRPDFYCPVPSLLGKR
eukprot:5439049-Pyramimonas_sp.AAC.1